MILVVQPICQVFQFKHLLNSDSHEKRKSSIKHLTESNSNEYNSFYQFSKIHHLLVIREGEESQEDSLKIRRDENFLEA